MKKKSKLNEFIQHTIDCESYGNVTKDEAIRLLKALYEEISKKIRKTSYIFTKKTYTKLLEEIEELLKEYKADMTSLYESSIKDISSYQAEWLQDFMKELDVNLIIPAAIVSTIKFSPIAKTTDYKGLIDNNVYKIRQNVDSSLRTAYLTKEELNDVADRFDKREKVIEQNVEKDTKAIATTAFSLTSYLMYKANKRKVVYCAILDSKTCIECGMLNGKEYEISKAPELPQHFGCRCNLIPIEALEEEDMPEDFETWFESLSEEEKIEAVGPSRYKFYQMGVPVTRFVDNQNKLIPVKELKAGGIIDKSIEEQDVFAKSYYQEIRNRKSKSDIDKIAKNTGISKEQIAAVRQYIFEAEDHLFDDGTRGRFDENHLIALSWERLSRNEFTDLDITLLNHEFEELTIVKDKGYAYKKAHYLADLKYPWDFLINPVYGGKDVHDIQKIVRELLKSYL